MYQQNILHFTENIILRKTTLTYTLSTIPIFFVSFKHLTLQSCIRIPATKPEIVNAMGGSGGGGGGQGLWTHPGKSQVI